MYINYYSKLNSLGEDAKNNIIKLLKDNNYSELHLTNPCYVSTIENDDIIVNKVKLEDGKLILMNDIYNILFLYKVYIDLYNCVYKTINQQKMLVGRLIRLYEADNIIIDYFSKSKSYRITLFNSKGKYDGEITLNTDQFNDLMKYFKDEK